MPSSSSPSSLSISLSSSSSVSSSSSSGGNWLSGYDKRKKITIDSTNVDVDLTDFPLFVEFENDADIGADIDSNGLNIRFTSRDGTTLLKYDRQYFNVAASQATGRFRVKIPTVKSASDTVIYVYYRANTPVDGEDRANTYRASIGGWWTLDEASGTLEDRTSNNRDGTVQGSPTYGQTGKLGDALLFDATTESYTIANIAEETAGCWLFWWKPVSSFGPADNVNRGLWLNGTTSTSRQFLRWRDFDSDGAVAFGQYDGSDWQEIKSTTTSWTGGQWYQVGARWDGSTIDVIIDGTEEASMSQGSPSTHTAVINIGRSAHGATYYTADGTVDDVKYFEEAISDAHVKFHYYNDGEADHELTFSAEQIQEGVSSSSSSPSSSSSSSSSSVSSISSLSSSSQSSVSSSSTSSVSSVSSSSSSSVSSVSSSSSSSSSVSSISSSSLSSPSSSSSSSVSSVSSLSSSSSSSPSSVSSASSSSSSSVSSSSSSSLSSLSSSSSPSASSASSSSSSSASSVSSSSSISSSSSSSSSVSSVSSLSSASSSSSSSSLSSSSSSVSSSSSSLSSSSSSSSSSSVSSSVSSSSLSSGKGLAPLHSGRVVAGQISIMFDPRLC